MSFTLFLFHLTMLITISPRLGCSSYVHDSFWIIKFVVITLVYIGCFFIPHSFYVVWAHICRAGSILFLVIQAYFLLNAAYALNDKLLMMTASGTQGEQTASKVSMLVLSIVLSGGISVWLGYQFYWAGACAIPLFVVITTSIFVVFFYVAALVKLCNVNVFRDNATVFTVSLACIYITYMSWSAMASKPDDDCQLNFETNTNTVLQIVFGLFFTLMTLMSIAMASADEVAKNGK